MSGAEGVGLSLDNTPARANRNGANFLFSAPLSQSEIITAPGWFAYERAYRRFRQGSSSEMIDAENAQLSLQDGVIFDEKLHKS